MTLDFVKMHAAGNDYIYLDCFGSEPDKPQKIAKMLSRRHFSVGADGIVLVLPSARAHARMRIFNADGSEASTCGNALRCVAKWLWESGFVRKSHITVETDSGIRDVFLSVRDGRVGAITVDMGVCRTGEHISLSVGGEKYELLTVRAGNEHQVAVTPDVDALDLARIGHIFEKNPHFEGGVNTEFYEIVGDNTLKVRTFERGSGETLACGSGACASALAAAAAGDCNASRPIKIRMRGGELSVLLLPCRNEEKTAESHPSSRAEALEHNSPKEMKAHASREIGDSNLALRAFLTGDAHTAFRGTVDM